jgi:hypothetical protein
VPEAVSCVFCSGSGYRSEGYRRPRFCHCQNGLRERRLVVISNVFAMLILVAMASCGVAGWIHHVHWAFGLFTLTCMGMVCTVLVMRLFRRGGGGATDSTPTQGGGSVESGIGEPVVTKEIQRAISEAEAAVVDDSPGPCGLCASSGRFVVAATRFDRFLVLCEACRSRYAAKLPVVREPK